MTSRTNLAAVLSVQTNNLSVAANGENGLLFDPSDPTALAAAIGRVFGDRSLADRMISGGLETAARFSWPRVIDDLEKVYGEASGSRCRH